MPCAAYRLDGRLVLVCSRYRGHKLPPACRACGGIGTFLCDFPIRDGGTCDAPLCAEHAHEVGPDKHYCPQHHALDGREPFEIG